MTAMQQATTIQTPSLPPGPRPWPLVGNALQLGRDPLGFLTAVQRRYGEIATVRIGRHPVILCFRPEHVRFFLVENAARVVSGQLAPNLKEVLGDGLLTSDGEYHRQQRALIAPAFHKKRIDGYAAIMTQYATEMVGTWRAGQTLDLARAMQALTLRIVARALIAVDLDADERGRALGRAFHDLIENGRPSFAAFHLPRFDLPFTRHGRHMAARRFLDAYIYDLIAQRRAAGGDSGDILSWLLAARDEAGEGMTDQQIRDQALTLFAAGHETTANALTWAFYLLSQHARVRETLLAELGAVLGGRVPTVADLPQLRYLDWVVTEALRLYPPAWTQGRIATEPFDLEGYQFRAGTVALFSQWVIHRRPDIWGDADTFRPERWDPDTAAKPPHWAYFPFGGGPRVCIGMPFAQMEARLLLATILQRFTPRLAPGHRVALRPRITLRPKYGMRMVLDETRLR